MEKNIIKISDTIKTKQDVNGNLITRNVTVTEHGDFEVSNGDLNINDLGIVKIANTTASTSSSTGALQVAGGIGVGGNSYFGGNLTVTNNIFVSDNYSISTYSTNQCIIKNKDSSVTSFKLNIANDITYDGASNQGTGIFIWGAKTDNTIGVGGSFPYLHTQHNPKEGRFEIYSGKSGDPSNAYPLTIGSGTKPTAISIKADGNVGINNTSPDYALDVNGGGNFNGTVKIENTTASTSSSTGALQVAGGIGVGENSYFLKNVTVDGTVKIANTTASTSSSLNVSLDVNGSVDISGYLYVADTSKFANRTILSSYGIGIGATPSNDGNFLTVGNGGTVKIANTTATVSTATGALVVSGGIGVGGKGYFGDGIGIGGSISEGTYLTVGRSGIVEILNETTASSTSAALKVSGGISAKQRCYFEGVVQVTNDTPASETSSTYGTGALQVAGGIGVGENSYFLKNVTVGGTVKIENTTASTYTTTGALQVAGGIGVGANSYFGGQLTSISGKLQVSYSEVDSSIINNYAVVLGGSTYIGKNLYVSGVVSATAFYIGGTELKPVVNNNNYYSTTSVNGLSGGSISGDVSISGKLTTTGYVGINNSNPDYELDVFGAAFISGNAYVGGKLACSSGNIISTITGLINIINNQPWGTSAKWKND